MIKKIFIYPTLFLLALSVNAQDDLLAELNEETGNQDQYELPAFKAMQIGNLQSTKIGDKGDLYLNVAHRFGSLKDGIDNFFGLDEANTKIQLTYSFFDGVQFGLSRDSFEKTYSLTSKVRIKRQSSKFPVNIVAYGAIDINTILKSANFADFKFGDRFSYVAQALVSRRIDKNLSLEIAPTYVRQNLQDISVTGGRTHNQFIMGLGGRIKVSKRMSINLDYALNLSRASAAKTFDPITLGVDIETGGHVFQLLFTNARGSNDSGYLSRTTGDFFAGDISFGFNVVRVF